MYVVFRFMVSFDLKVNLNFARAIFLSSLPLEAETHQQTLTCPLRLNDNHLPPYFVFHPFDCFLAPSSGRSEYLFAVVSDGGEDGAQRLEAHGDVQQVGSKEEVVEVAENGHGGVPDQIQEVLRGRWNVTL